MEDEELSDLIFDLLAHLVRGTDPEGAMLALVIMLRAVREAIEAQIGPEGAESVALAALQDASDTDISGLVAQIRVRQATAPGGRR